MVVLLIWCFDNLQVDKTEDTEDGTWDNEDYMIINP